MKDEIILKLLRSSNLDDIKLGVLYLGRRKLDDIIIFYDKYGDNETIFKITKRIEHSCETVPSYIPEHRIQGTNKSILIYRIATTVYNTTAINQEEFF